MPSPTSTEANTKPAALVAAFLVLYGVWGATFLGIRIAVETIPPLTLAAVRFLISGTVLWLVSRRAQPRPTAEQWKNAALTGALFFLLNHALVCSAAKYLPSSLVALIIASEVPIIALLSAWLVPGRRLEPRSLLGASLGVAGVLCLFVRVGLGLEHLALLPCLAVVGASLSWATGAVLSQRLELAPNALVRASMQMLCGAAMLSAASLVTGEAQALRWSDVSARSLWAFAFLVVFGSVLAFACYTWLLQRVRAETVATHAFVNPLVAVVLGTWLGGERLLLSHLLAGGLILCSVWVIAVGSPSWRPRRLRTAKAAPGDATC